MTSAFLNVANQMIIWTDMGELYLFYVTEHRLLIIKLLFIHLGLLQTAALFSGFNVDVL